MISSRVPTLHPHRLSIRPAHSGGLRASHLNMEETIFNPPHLYNVIRPINTSSAAHAPFMRKTRSRGRSYAFGTRYMVSRAHLRSTRGRMYL